jgi:hypothetical protein
MFEQHPVVTPDTWRGGRECLLASLWKTKMNDRMTRDEVLKAVAALTSIGDDLSEADLSGADLSGATGADLAVARTRILPEGALIGWKKCQEGVIVKLRIPEGARRSHSFGRKCRAEYADVIGVFGSHVGISKHDGTTEYRVGARVAADAFSDDWTTECAPGIHFFITRIEAENY